MTEKDLGTVNNCGACPWSDWDHNTLGTWLECWHPQRPGGSESYGKSCGEKKYDRHPPIPDWCPLPNAKENPDG